MYIKMIFGELKQTAITNSAVLHSLMNGHIPL